MGYIYVENSYLFNIANMIRNRLETDKSYVLNEMASAIRKLNNEDANFVLIDKITRYFNPKVTSLRSYAFQSYPDLININLTSCSSIGAYAFQNCTSLSFVSLPICTNFGSYAFDNCTTLFALNLENLPSIPTLAHSNAFNNCINMKSIYVPASLFYIMKSATNWSYFSDWMTSLPCPNF